MKLIKLSSLILATLLIFGSVSAQETVKTEDQPDIKVEAQFRVIDVVVMDDDEHIEGLKKNNFKIKEGDQFREIVSIKEVNLLEDDTEDAKSFEEQVAAEEGKQSVQPNFYIFIIANIRHDKRTIERLQEGIEEFFDENFKPFDRGALFVATNRGIMKVVDFSSDKKILVDYTRKLFAKHQLIPNELSFTVKQLQMTLLDNLKMFMNELSRVQGRKNIFFVSSGMPFVTDMAKEKKLNPSTNEISQVEMSQVDQSLRKEINTYTDVIRKLGSVSNTTLHVLDAASRSNTRRRGTDDGFAEAYIASANTGDFARTDSFNRSQNQNFMVSQRLGLLTDIAAAGEGELYTTSLRSTGTLVDNLEEVYNLNLHYYRITYRVERTGGGDEFAPVQVEVTHDDAEDVYYKKYVRTVK